MSNTDKAVVVADLRKSFGSVTALRGISFEVGRGEVLGLLGPNGAGKTTTVDILSTLASPTSGTAIVAGHDVRTDAAAVRRSITLTGQHVALDDMLTGRQNLVMFGRLQGLKKVQARSRAVELLERFDLVEAGDRSVKNYSGGMRRRIDIACGLMVRPEVVFLDEPTTGLDPRSRLAIWELVSDFKAEGIATLLTTQYLEEADSLADRIIVIDKGRIIAEGTADSLKERTGGTYCEIVPRDMNDVPAVAAALGSLLPDENRATLTDASDRVSMPAPDGANTLISALNLITAADIELQDIALRRPSLDEVFLRLTGQDSRSENGRRGSAGMTVDTAAGAIPATGRPVPSTLQQWWTLTTRTILPTFTNGELATQVVSSIVFTVGFYLPLKNILGALQPMSSYAQYLTPLIVVQAIFFAAVSAAFRSALDALAGINRRFRAMPMAALTPLAARMTASMYRVAIALVVSLVCGHVIGFRFHGTWWHTAGFIGLCLLIGAALALGGDLIGAATRNPEATAPLLLVPQVTLGLASNGLQPVERFPSWIQPFVRDQPLSQQLNALRAFAGDSTTAAPAVTWSVVGPALAWTGAMIVVFTVLHARVAARRS